MKMIKILRNDFVRKHYIVLSALILSGVGLAVFYGAIFLTIALIGA